MLRPVFAAVALVLLLGACDTAPKPVAAAAPKPPEQPRTFSLFFAFDSTRLSPEAMAVVKDAAGAFKARQNAHVVIVGHTDTMGAGAYNMELSRRRAAAVKDALVKEGLPAQAIDTNGQGEDQLTVSTKDNIRESQNRRVEVTVQ